MNDTNELIQEEYFEQFAGDTWRERRGGMGNLFGIDFKQPLPERTPEQVEASKRWVANVMGALRSLETEAAHE